MAWQDGFGKVSVIEHYPRYVHLRVEDHFRILFLTFVYANPQAEARHDRWSNLSRIKNGIHRDWALIRDFNEIMDASEKNVEPPSILEEA